MFILETGMGGRLDSTTFSSAAVTAITSIGLISTVGPGHDPSPARRPESSREGVPCVLGILPPRPVPSSSERSMRLGWRSTMACPMPMRQADLEWLARNRAVARRILRLIPGDSRRG